jgi:hypothetical protein
MATRRGVPLYDTAIEAAHAKGLANREIAAIVGCHHRTVAEALRRLGLTTNLARGVPPVPVDAHHARCRRCESVQPNDLFPFVRGKADGRRLSICRACRARQARAALGASPETYFADRERRMRSGDTGRRPARSWLSFELPDGYLLGLWLWQTGKCFYTDEPMTTSLGAGFQRTAASIDRVEPHLAYSVGNVVRDWMPGWYQRVAELLPRIVAEVKPIADTRPRAADGRRLPSWVVERRARLEQLRAAGDVGQ